MSKKTILIIAVVVVLVVLGGIGIFAYSRHNLQPATAGLSAVNPNAPTNGSVSQSGVKISVSIVQSSGIISSAGNFFTVVGPAVVKLDIAPAAGYSCGIGPPGIDTDKLHTLSGEVSKTLNMSVHSIIFLGVECKDPNGNWGQTQTFSVKVLGPGDASSTAPIQMVYIPSPW